MDWSKPATWSSGAAPGRDEEKAQRRRHEEECFSLRLKAISGDDDKEEGKGALETSTMIKRSSSGEGLMMLQALHEDEGEDEEAPDNVSLGKL